METATILWAILPRGHTDGQKVIPLLMILKEDFDDFLKTFDPPLVVPGFIADNEKFLSRFEKEYPEIAEKVRDMGPAVKIQLLPNNIPVYEPPSDMPTT